MPVAISASFAWVIWRSASVCPNIFRSRARASASSRARLAKPSAAPGTAHDAGPIVMANDAFEFDDADA